MGADAVRCAFNPHNHASTGKSKLANMHTYTHTCTCCSSHTCTWLTRVHTCYGSCACTCSGTHGRYMMVHVHTSTYVHLHALHTHAGLRALIYRHTLLHRQRGIPSSM